MKRIRCVDLFLDNRVKAGDILTIQGQIISRKVQGFSYIFVFAEGKDKKGEKIIREIPLHHIKDAVGDWADYCWIHGIFDRPFRVASITEYPHKKVLTLERV